MTSSRKITAELLAGELVFTASRSGGPGGQNVNKVNSKINLQFHVESSLILTPEEKEVIAKKLSSKINREGVLLLSAQESRSQSDNKDSVIGKFNVLMAKAFERRKPRKSHQTIEGVSAGSDQKKEGRV